MTAADTAGPARPHFFEGQTVDAALLTAAQDWLDDGLARHQRTNHRWGIIYGLALTADDGGGLWLEPGAACDAMGESLCVAGALRLSPSEHAGGSAGGSAGTGGTLDIWLRQQVSAGPPGRRRIGALPFAFPAAGTEPVDSEQPLDPDGRTAVYLGRLRHDGAGWRPLAVRRRSVGLTAGRLADPGGSAVVTLGATGGPGQQSLEIAASAAPPAVSLDPAGTLTLNGILAAPSFALGGAGLALAEPAERPPPEPRPWTLGTAPATLILELPAGGRLTVGSGDGPAFRPILSVAASGDVEIGGALDAGGTIAQAAVPADAADPRFVEALLAAIKAIPPVKPAPTPGAKNGSNPPAERDNPPAERDNPPAERDNPPAERNNPPAERDNPPAERNNP